jgi:hypothetical protein
MTLNYRANKYLEIARRGIAREKPAEGELPGHCQMYNCDESARAAIFLLSAKVSAILPSN